MNIETETTTKSIYYMYNLKHREFRMNIEIDTTTIIYIINFEIFVWKCRYSQACFGDHL